MALVRSIIGFLGGMVDGIVGGQNWLGKGQVWNKDSSEQVIGVHGWEGTIGGSDPLTRPCLWLVAVLLNWHFALIANVKTYVHGISHELLWITDKCWIKLLNHECCLVNGCNTLLTWRLFSRFKYTTYILVRLQICCKTEQPINNCLFQHTRWWYTASFFFLVWTNTDL